MLAYCCFICRIQSFQHVLFYERIIIIIHITECTEIQYMLRKPSIGTKNPDIYERISSNHIKYKTCVLLRNSATKEFN